MFVFLANLCWIRLLLSNFYPFNRYTITVLRLRNKQTSHDVRRRRRKWNHLSEKKDEVDIGIQIIRNTVKIIITWYLHLPNTIILPHCGSIPFQNSRVAFPYPIEYEYQSRHFHITSSPVGLLSLEWESDDWQTLRVWRGEALVTASRAVVLVVMDGTVARAALSVHFCKSFIMTNNYTWGSRILRITLGLINKLLVKTSKVPLWHLSHDTKGNLKTR